MKIDIPWINTVVRDRINRGADSSAFDPLVERLTPDVEPGGIDLQKRLFGTFETLARLGSATAPVSNWLADAGPVRAALERVLGVDRRRALPAFERETFRAWFRARESSVADPVRRVVVYPDVYTNHVRTERGKAAVRTLEALNVDVVVSDVAASGRAPLSQGMIATAESKAHAAFADLEPYLEDGRDVVVIEPSGLAMFQREYSRLLPTADHGRVADTAYEIVEYVYGLLEAGGDASVLSGPEPTDDADGVAYHSHCQQRTLRLERHTEAVLDRLGYDVVTSDAECCGMAGSFGYKSEYYELSVAVGEDPAEGFRSDVARDRTVVASGTSCSEQPDLLLDRPWTHHIELIAPDG